MKRCCPDCGGPMIRRRLAQLNLFQKAPTTRTIYVCRHCSQVETIG